MHALCSICIAATFVLLASAGPTPPHAKLYEMDVPKKCCRSGYLFDEQLRCVKDRSNGAEPFDSSLFPEEGSSESEWQIPDYEIVCLEDATTAMSDSLTRAYAILYVPSELCVDLMTNGSEVLAECPDWPLDPAKGGTTNSTATETREKKGKSVVPLIGDLGTVVFWGAQTYMSTNIAHVVLCLIVVAIYLSVPALGKGLYNRAILRHNVCLLTLGCILTLLGYCDLRECPFDGNATILLWLLLQYFTIATVFWLNVVCFVTSSITRFRWMLGSGKRTDKEENQRLLVYGVFVWGGALLPVVVAGILEYVPNVPEDFPLKPNYLRFRNGPNLVVNLYFFGIPMLTLFWNNALFVLTTYRLVRILRSTEIATKNNDNAARKKYFLFLRLYLLMGAPWFFGCLLACLNKLVTLKICRLIQPILWLLMLATHKKVRRKIAKKLCRDRNEDHRQATSTNP